MFTRCDVISDFREIGLLAISQRWPSGDNARWSNGGPTAEMTRLRRYANGVPTLGQRPKCCRASVGSHRQANDMRRWLTTFCQRRANVCLLSGQEHKHLPSQRLYVLQFGILTSQTHWFKSTGKLAQPTELVL